MDTVPLASAIIGDLAAFAAIVGYLWPVFVRQETLPELLRRRFSGRPAAPVPGGQSLAPPKSQWRAILNILALVVPLLLLVGSSLLIGSIILRPKEPIIMGTPTPPSTAILTPTPTPALTPTSTPTPTPSQVVITLPTPGSKVESFITVQGTASNIPAGEELWLFVTVQGVSGYYPQGDKPITISSSGRWSRGAQIGQENSTVDVGKRFTLIPVLIKQNDSDAHNRIQAYFQQAGTYQPIPSGDLLTVDFSQDQVEVVRQ